MYILKTSAAFDSAHFLAGYNGKCANLHGHHWVIEAEAAADSLQESGEKRGMIYCVVTRAQIMQIKSIVGSVDPHAFATVSAAHEVMGEGFKQFSSKE